MVTDEKIYNAALTRYRLGNASIWLGVLTWLPFIILRIAGHAFCACAIRATQDDQFAGLQNREEVHAMRILSAPRNTQPPPG